MPAWKRLFALLTLLFLHGAATAAPPPLQLARIYDFDRDPGEYWISEKLDGVRAYWDGHNLYTRSGRLIAIPREFLDDFPQQALDGELWAGRGGFERISGLIQRQSSRLVDWDGVRYMVFDQPLPGTPFDRRLQGLRELFARIESKRIALIEQFRTGDREELRQRLAAVMAGGGEGLMLHHQDAQHRAGRSSNLLKLRPYADAEARVIGHLPGKGRLQGLLGALLVETASGQRFRLGGGFSDAQRVDPPPIGAVVTFRHEGLTANGLPRFARFLRLRPPE